MIGLIFGETSFPKEILKKVKKKRKKYLIIDLTKKKSFKKDQNSYPVSLGQFGGIINILKANYCKRVLFAGSVKKPNFSKLRLDLKGIYDELFGEKPQEKTQAPEVVHDVSKMEQELGYWNVRDAEERFMQEEIERIKQHQKNNRS